MTDTLIVFAEAGDSLCVDVVEPVGHWRLFFRDSFELGELLVEAAEQEGMSIESVRVVLADSLAPIIAFHERRMRRSWVDELPRAECARPEERPPGSARSSQGCGRGFLLDPVAFIAASLVVAILGGFWLLVAALVRWAWA